MMLSRSPLYQMLTAPIADTGGAMMTQASIFYHVKYRVRYRVKCHVWLA